MKLWSIIYHYGYKLKLERNLENNQTSQFEGVCGSLEPTMGGFPTVKQRCVSKAEISD